jgi:hypothetical protein
MNALSQFLPPPNAILWNMPEPRTMATPRRHKKKGHALHKPYFPRSFTILALLLFIALPSRVIACAACFGQSDSEMAKGLNAGIFWVLSIRGVASGFFAGIFMRRSIALPLL